MTASALVRESAIVQQPAEHQAGREAPVIFAVTNIVGPVVESNFLAFAVVIADIRRMTVGVGVLN